MKTTVIVLLLLGPMHLLAWGPTGHRAIGVVAHEHLSAKARKKVLSILEGQSLAMAGTWMDEVRADRKYSHWADWHWVTIPDGKTYEETEKNPRGDIIQTLERVILELKGGKLTLEEQRERLKILVHLVGDIHQPLHVGTGDDQGGNEKKVKWFNKRTNLHRVWDSEMIEHSLLSYTELAQSLARPSKQERAQWQQASVREWAMESYGLRAAVYATGDDSLGYGYSYTHWDTVRLRLLQAGIRLAAVLNDLYG